MASGPLDKEINIGMRFTQLGGQTLKEAINSLMGLGEAGKKAADLLMSLSEQGVEVSKAFLQEEVASLRAANAALTFAESIKTLTAATKEYTEAEKGDRNDSEAKARKAEALKALTAAMKENNAAAASLLGTTETLITKTEKLEAALERAKPIDYSSQKASLDGLSESYLRASENTQKLIEAELKEEVVKRNLLSATTALAEAEARDDGSVTRIATRTAALERYLAKVKETRSAEAAHAQALDAVINPAVGLSGVRVDPAIAAQLQQVQDEMLATDATGQRLMSVQRQLGSEWDKLTATMVTAGQYLTAVEQKTVLTAQAQKEGAAAVARLDSELSRYVGTLHKTTQAEEAFLAARLPAAEGTAPRTDLIDAAGAAYERATAEERAMTSATRDLSEAQLSLLSVREKLGLALASGTGTTGNQLEQIRLWREYEAVLGSVEARQQHLVDLATPATPMVPQYEAVAESAATYGASSPEERELAAAKRGLVDADLALTAAEERVATALATSATTAREQIGLWEQLDAVRARKSGAQERVTAAEASAAHPAVPIGSLPVDAGMLTTLRGEQDAYKALGPLEQAKLQADRLLAQEQAKLAEMTDLVVRALSHEGDEIVLVAEDLKRLEAAQRNIKPQEARVYAAQQAQNRAESAYAGSTESPLNQTLASQVPDAAALKAMNEEKTDLLRLDAAHLAVTTTARRLVEAEKTLAAAETEAAQAATALRESVSLDAESMLRANAAAEARTKALLELAAANHAANAAEKAASPTPGGGMGNSGIGDFFRYQVMYMAGYAVMNKVIEAFTNAQNLGLQEAGFGGGLHIAPDVVQQYVKSYSDFAQSGQSPVDVSTALKASYIPATMGNPLDVKTNTEIVKVGSLLALGQGATGGSSTGVAQVDPTDATTAISAVKAIYKTSASPEAIANSIAGATVASTFDLTQIAQAAPMFLDAAKRLGVSYQEAIGGYAGMSVAYQKNPVEAAQNLESLFRDLMKPTMQARQYGTALGLDLGPSFLKNSGGLEKALEKIDAVTYDPVTAKTKGDQAARAEQATVLHGLFNATDANVIMAILANPNWKLDMAGAKDSSGKYYADSVANAQKNPAVQLTEQETKLADSMRTLVTNLQPAETALVAGLANVTLALTDFVKNMPGMPGANPGKYFGGGANFLQHFTSLGDKGFLNADVAQQEAAADEARAQAAAAAKAKAAAAAKANASHNPWQGIAPGVGSGDGSSGGGGFWDSVQSGAWNLTKAASLAIPMNPLVDIIPIATALSFAQHPHMPGSGDGHSFSDVIKAAQAQQKADAAAFDQQVTALVTARRPFGKGGLQRTAETFFGNTLPPPPPSLPTTDAADVTFGGSWVDWAKNATPTTRLPNQIFTPQQASAISSLPTQVDDAVKSFAITHTRELILMRGGGRGAKEETTAITAVRAAIQSGNPDSFQSALEQFRQALADSVKSQIRTPQDAQNYYDSLIPGWTAAFNKVASSKQALSNQLGNMESDVSFALSQGDYALAASLTTHFVVPYIEANQKGLDFKGNMPRKEELKALQQGVAPQLQAQLGAIQDAIAQTTDPGQIAALVKQYNALIEGKTGDFSNAQILSLTPTGLKTNEKGTAQTAYTQVMTGLNEHMTAALGSGNQAEMDRVAQQIQDTATAAAQKGTIRGAQADQVIKQAWQQDTDNAVNTAQSAMSAAQQSGNVGTARQAATAEINAYKNKYGKGLLTWQQYTDAVNKANDQPIQVDIANAQTNLSIAQQAGDVGAITKYENQILGDEQQRADLSQISQGQVKLDALRALQTEVGAAMQSLNTQMGAASASGDVSLMQRLTTKAVTAETALYNGVNGVHGEDIDTFHAHLDTINARPIQTDIANAQVGLQTAQLTGNQALIKQFNDQIIGDEEKLVPLHQISEAKVKLDQLVQLKNELDQQIGDLSGQASLAGMSGNFSLLETLTTQIIGKEDQKLAKGTEGKTEHDTNVAKYETSKYDTEMGAYRPLLDAAYTSGNQSLIDTYTNLIIGDINGKEHDHLISSAEAQVERLALLGRKIQSGMAQLSAQADLAAGSGNVPLLHQLDAKLNAKDAQSLALRQETPDQYAQNVHGRDARETSTELGNLHSQLDMARANNDLSGAHAIEQHIVALNAHAVAIGAMTKAAASLEADTFKRNDQADTLKKQQESAGLAQTTYQTLVDSHASQADQDTAWKESIATQRQAIADNTQLSPTARRTQNLSLDDQNAVHQQEVTNKRLALEVQLAQDNLTWVQQYGGSVAQQKAAFAEYQAAEKAANASRDKNDPLQARVDASHYALENAGFQHNLDMTRLSVEQQIAQANFQFVQQYGGTVAQQQQAFTDYIAAEWAVMAEQDKNDPAKLALDRLHLRAETADNTAKNDQRQFSNLGAAIQVALGTHNYGLAQNLENQLGGYQGRYATRDGVSGDQQALNAQQSAKTAAQYGEQGILDSLALAKATGTTAEILYWERKKQDYDKNHAAALGLSGADLATGAHGVALDDYNAKRTTIMENLALAQDKPDNQAGVSYWFQQLYNLDFANKGLTHMSAAALGKESQDTANENRASRLASDQQFATAADLFYKGVQLQGGSADQLKAAADQIYAAGLQSLKDQGLTGLAYDNAKTSLDQTRQGQYNAADQTGLTSLQEAFQLASGHGITPANIPAMQAAQGQIDSYIRAHPGLAGNDKLKMQLDSQQLADSITSAQQTDAQKQVKEFQNQISLAQLQGNMGRANQTEQAMLAFEKGSENLLGLTDSDLALQKAQYDKQRLSSALSGPELINAQASPSGDALAGYGRSVAALAVAPAVSGQAELIRSLQRTIEQQAIQIQILQGIASASLDSNHIQSRTLSAVQALGPSGAAAPPPSKASAPNRGQGLAH